MPQRRLDLCVKSCLLIYVGEGGVRESQQPHTTVEVSRSENSLEESILFYSVGSKDWTRLLGLLQGLFAMLNSSPSPFCAWSEDNQ